MKVEKYKPASKMFLFAVLSFLSLPSVYAVENCIPWDSSNNKTGLLIGKVNINTSNIFDSSDPKESRKIHRTANKLHIQTKNSTIRNQLIMKAGDPYKPRQLKEMQRLLRGNSYIKNATVIPLELCGNRVTINIKTTDKWSFTPSISFGRQGGKNKSGVEIQEHNLFGLGKSLTIKHKNNTTRKENNLRYDDPQLLGSNKNLTVSLNDNSDGKGHKIDLNLPFYGLDSRKAWGISSSQLNQGNPIYNMGKEVDNVKEIIDQHSGFYGWSNGLVDDHVSRFKVGWHYKSRQAKQLSPITESFPFFEYNYQQENFITKENVETMGQLEDISLGEEYSLGIGFLREEFGSTDNLFKLSTTYKKGFQFENSLAFVDINANSYLGSGSLEGQELDLKGEWFRFNSNQKNDLYFSVNAKAKTNLQLGEQLLLGGDNGLRGYPTGFQNGDKSVVFSAEKRFHYNWYPYSLVKFGAVAFADVGTAWGNGNDPDILADVGIGLRIIPTRSSSTKAVHLDLAFPINSGDVDNFQISIKTKQTF